MKTEIHTDCINLWNIIKQEDELKRLINTKLTAYTESNRKYSNGETVIICSTITHEEIGRGLVTSARTHINLDIFELKEYINLQRVSDDLELRYEIYALKKDGTQSTKHFFQAPHFISENQSKGEYYIKKIS